MHVDPKTGLLDEAFFLPSPHYEPRQESDEIDCIVIHSISLPKGEFGGLAIDALFLGTLNVSGHPSYGVLEGVRVSAHLLIRRDGTLTQYVPFHQQAWHAGDSEWAGRSRCNEYSIGIELEGTDEQPYESEQYEQLIRAIQAIRVCYKKISLDRIVGHSAVAPHRKTDPGPAFDWSKLLSGLGCSA